MAITFESIGGGALAEKFQMGLAQIGRNFMDPNMDRKAARSMTIVLKFKPGGGGAINVEFDVKTKLAGFEKDETLFTIGQDARTGRIAMSEYGGDRGQVTTLETVPPSAYTEIRGKGGDRDFDEETGEIYDPPAEKKPIDLRAVK